MRYRIRCRVIVQHRDGGRCKIFNKYFRAKEITAVLAQKSAWLKLLMARGYEIVEETSVGGWVK